MQLSYGTRVSFSRVNQTRPRLSFAFPAGLAKWSASLVPFGVTPKSCNVFDSPQRMNVLDDSSEGVKAYSRVSTWNRADASPFYGLAVEAGRGIRSKLDRKWLLIATPIAGPPPFGFVTQ